MKKINIIQFLPYFSPHKGGLETHAQDIKEKFNREINIEKHKTMLDSNRINIAFMAPSTKGGPYYIYKEIVNALNEKYGDNISAQLYNTKKSYLKLHFKKYDYIFSIIPFIFKPIGAKKYIYNIHGNFKIEKKKKGIGNKLLYLAKNNLKICDTIMLTSYFLADKLSFKNKYKDKIFILPNFIKITKEELNTKKLKNKKDIKILTVSSTKFLEKGRGIVDLGEQIKNIKDINIEWTIIAGGNNNNKETIKKDFYIHLFPKNIKIKRIDWVDKNTLDKYYKDADIFIYGTRLDTWGMTIMEAMSFGLPVILLEYELRKHIFPKSIISNNIKNKLTDVISNYQKYSNISISFIKDQASIEETGKKIFKLLKKGDDRKK